MPYRYTPLINENFYHIFNRGVEKRAIFLEDRDYQRFLQTLYYYQFGGPKPKFSNQRRFHFKEFEKNPKIVEIICYCLMPNHFHLIIRQLKDKGIKEFISKVINSYTKYFNTKYKRVGPLFQGEFKAVLIETDEQLVQVSRYIHLNPYVSEITNEWEKFAYSSYREFTSSPKLCATHHVLDLFGKTQQYQDFVKDHASYALDISKFKHALIDPEE